MIPWSLAPCLLPDHLQSLLPLHPHLLPFFPPISTALESNLGEAGFLPCSPQPVSSGGGSEVGQRQAFSPPFPSRVFHQLSPYRRWALAHSQQGPGGEQRGQDPVPHTVPLSRAFPSSGTGAEVSSHLLAMPRPSQHRPCSTDTAPLSPERLGTSRIPLSQPSLFPPCGPYGSDLSSLFGWPKTPNLKKLVVRAFWKKQQPEWAD